jgi:hypothetical protein
MVLYDHNYESLENKGIFDDNIGEELELGVHMTRNNRVILFICLVITVE